MSDPDEEVMIGRDKPSGFRSGVFLEADVTAASKGCASCRRRRFKSHAWARIQKWTSPKGNAIKYLQRLELTVKNC